MGAWGRQHEMSFTKAFQDTICNHIHAGKEENVLGLSPQTRLDRYDSKRDQLTTSQINGIYHLRPIDS